MNIAKNSVVSIDYTLFDSEGTELDSSKGGSPLSYLHGADNIIAGLEKALEGKAPGDSLKVTVPAAEAYGEKQADLVVTLPKDRFEDGIDIQVGMQFQAESEDGVRIVTVSKVGENDVTIDANHPMAGKDLTFDVSIVDVREATEEELAHGHPHHEHGCGCGDDCGDGCGCGDDCGDDEGCCGSGGCGCH